MRASFSIPSSYTSKPQFGNKLTQIGTLPLKKLAKLENNVALYVKHEGEILPLMKFKELLTKLFHLGHKVNKTSSLPLYAKQIPNKF